MGRKVVVLVALGLLVGAISVGGLGWYLLHTRTLVFQSDRTSRIAVPEEITAQVMFDQPASIRFAEKFTVDAAIETQMEVPVEQTFSIPLDFELTFPVNTTMRVDQDFEIEVDVPLHFELSPDDLKLGTMTVDLDTEVYIDDEVEVEFTVPVESTLSAFGMMPVPVSGEIPVNVRVPINQPVRIRDKVEVGLSDFGLVVDTVVPIKMQVPIHQDVQVSGEVTGRFRKTIQAPVSELISVPIKQNVPVGLDLTKGVQIMLEDFTPTRIRFDEPLPVQVESMTIAPGDLRIQRLDLVPESP